MPTVSVQLGPRSYPIEIGTGNLAQITGLVQTGGRTTRAVVVADRRVEPTHAATVLSALRGAGLHADLVAIPSGESSKSVAQLAALWQKLLDLGADRRSVVVAVGGGVVGDLAGFAAATFARGVRFVQVPTTLLAQVDSSVGGKTGINLPAAKNIVGAFWQPTAVLIDTATLETLPPREYRSGLAEVVKYGVILDAEFFGYLEAQADGLVHRYPEVLEHVIARSCQLKADIVAQDEREETGQRAVLNYGHTFAHAFETVTSYGQLLHGEAVSIGMACAARLAKRLGRIDGEFVDRQRQLLVELGLPVTLLDIDAAAVIAAMAHDKKVEHGRLRFVLPTRLGHVELVDYVPLADVQAALSE